MHHTSNPPSPLAGISLTLSKTEYMELQDTSIRLKAIREPVRELARNVQIETSPPNEQRTKLLQHAKHQLQIAQTALQDYLVSLSSEPQTTAIKEAMSPKLLEHRIQQQLESLNPSTRHQQLSPLHIASLSPRLYSPPPIQSATKKANHIERAVVRMWQDKQFLNTAAKPVNEIYLRMSKRHVSSIEERIPQVPIRQLVNRHQPAASHNVIDLLNTLFRSSTVENEASLLNKQLESIPPGIVACAIANSTTQLFCQLTQQSIREYVTGSSKNEHTSGPAASPVLRLLSDHANFLTRLMENSIMYPIQASQRACRIEWWAVVACLLRELGDYESLNSIICALSSSIVISRLQDTWSQVAGVCTDAIKFILDRVLKIHPNYANYRDELTARIKKLNKKPKSAGKLSPWAIGKGDESLSLDFDSAIAINTPDLCSSNDNYVSSCVFSKEGFDLPPPRTLVPIVAVLLKDAVSADVSPSQADAKQEPPQWISILESSARQEMPLVLDYFMLRRIFSTELSSLPSLMPSRTAHTSTPRALAAATTLLKRMPRRRSHFSNAAADGSTRELSMTNCRILGDTANDGAPTIVDLLAHLLYLSSGNPCYTCSVGSLLEDLHVATSGQLAVVVATMMVFAEPWMPRECLTRLCDLREPKTAHPISYQLSRSPPATTIPSQTVSLGRASGRQKSPWLMSFRLNDTADTDRYSKRKSHMLERAGTIVKPTNVDANRKTSTDSDSTCVNRPGSPQQQPLQRSLSSNSSKSNQSAVSVTSTIVPNLPPLPANVDLPPLPMAQMPKWSPSDNPHPQVPRSGSKTPPPPASKRMLPEDAPPLPPLPVLPMPKFQPPSMTRRPPISMSPPPASKKMPTEDVSPLPTIPGTFPRAAAKSAVARGLLTEATICEKQQQQQQQSSYAGKVSAEAQMLLSFDVRGDGCQYF